jgi:hypothetical protein
MTKTGLLAERVARKRLLHGRVLIQSAVLVKVSGCVRQIGKEVVCLALGRSALSAVLSVDYCFRSETSALRSCQWLMIRNREFALS